MYKSWLLLLLIWYPIGKALLQNSSCSPPSKYGLSEKYKCNLCNENCASENDPYYKGDLKEVLQVDSVYIAIDRAIDEGNYCYICISYYNFSQDDFSFEDSVIVKYRNNSEKDLNEKRKWNAEFTVSRGNKDVYRIWNTEDTLQEGTYKFSFNHSKELHQFYIKDNRLFKNTTVRDRIILDSWRSVSPVSSNFTDTQTNLRASWYVNNIDLSYQFRNCFDYNLGFKNHYEPTLKIDVQCELSEIRYSHWNCTVTITENETKIKTENFDDSNRPKNLKVDLFCIVRHRGNSYVFNQPVMVYYNISDSSPSNFLAPSLSTPSFGREAADLTISPNLSVAKKSTMLPGTGNAPILVSIAAILFSLAVIVCLLYHFKHISKKRQRKTSSKMKLENNRNNLESLKEVDGPVLPKWLIEKKEMIYDPRCIEKGKNSWHGYFGSVFEAKIRLGNAVYPVAVKTPKNLAGTEIHEFLEEAKSMLEIKEYHDNIVNLQGITYTKGQNDNYSIEYCSKGSLRSYLVNHASEFKKSLEYYENNICLEPLTTRNRESNTHDISLLYSWTYQVANGMAFLAEKHIYHGDLAARNVLLTDSLIAKISDFGLARRLYHDVKDPQPLVKQTDEGKQTSLLLPMKWLAIEVLLHQQITHEKSDVWSFGVLTWEIFQLGADPYRPGITTAELISELQGGLRLPAPQSCPSPISLLIHQCFQEKPSDRPSFMVIKHKIEVAYHQLRRPQTTIAQVETCEDEILHYADIQHESRYLDMKAKNRKYQDEQMTNIDEDSDIDLNIQSFTISFKKDVAQESLIENMRSPVNHLSVSKDSGLQKQTIDDHTNLLDVPNTGYRLSLSPGSTEHKRFFSYGGEDLPLINPAGSLSKQQFGCTKSHPNPTYMMFLDDIDKTEQDSRPEPWKE